MKDLFIEVGGNPCIVTVSDGYGEAVVNGRKWRWDWHDYCGPLFLNADGSERKRIPSKWHPVWKAVKEWQKERAKEEKAS